MNKASQNNEVRELASGRWAIMGCSNSSITYYATSKEDAEQTLQEWDAAPDLLKALKILKIEIEPLQLNRRGAMLCNINAAINKATIK